MDEKTTQTILSHYYRGQDVPVDVGESSPLKRSRLSMTGMNTASANSSVMNGEDEERESTDGLLADDLSGDDLEASRGKRLRPTQ